jgi:hypothetical protein
MPRLAGAFSFLFLFHNFPIFSPIPPIWKNRIINISLSVYCHLTLYKVRNKVPLRKGGQEASGWPSFPVKRFLLEFQVKEFKGNLRRQVWS